MASETTTRNRALSHAEYLETLHAPTVEESRRISEIQCRRESEINQKYHTSAEHEAATTIQKAYRGHRMRRQLDGLTLDPSERWTAIIKEWKFRNATTPQRGHRLSQVANDGRPRAPSDVAKRNWQRLGQIAEHAGGGADSPSPGQERDAFLSGRNENDSSRSQVEENSLLMDTRYFLEMVDQKHRYGTNLLAYHEQWLHSQTDQNFFYWLDRGEGKHLSLSVCNRERLDRERVRYLTKDERRDYLVRVDEEGKLRWQKNDELITTSVEQFKDSMVGIVPKTDVKTPTFADESVKREQDETRHIVSRLARHRSGSDASLGSISGSDSSDSEEIVDSTQDNQGSPKKKKKKKFQKMLRVSPAAILNQLLKASVRPGTWIYVADTVGRLYVGIKSSGAFQHASFLSGSRISSAGLITIENGQLTYLSPLSGHYRPTTKSFRMFIRSLKNQGVDVSHLRISGAFKVLLTMEYYGKVTKHETKKKKHEVQNMVLPSKDHQVKGSPRLDGRSSPETGLTSTEKETKLESATGEVERHWDREHRHGLGKLIDDLHLRPRSSEGKKTEH